MVLFGCFWLSVAMSANATSRCCREIGAAFRSWFIPKRHSEQGDRGREGTGTLIHSSNHALSHRGQNKFAPEFVGPINRVIPARSTLENANKQTHDNALRATTTTRSWRLEGGMREGGVEKCVSHHISLYRRQLRVTIGVTFHKGQKAWKVKMLRRGCASGWISLFRCKKLKSFDLL